MDAFKGIFNDAGDLFDSIKDKIASPSSDKASSDSGSRDASNAVKKISFENMTQDLDEAGEMPGSIPPQIVLDVLVVGAGLAGLTTAYRLLQNDEDLRVRVVEATERVGGRLLTRSIKTAGAGKDFFDVGGEWLSRKQKRMMDLTTELGLETYRQNYAGAKILVPVDGKPVPFLDNFYPINMFGRYDLNSFIARLEILRQYVPVDDPTQCEDAMEWDGITLEAFKKSHTWTEAGRLIFDALVVLNLGVTPREISLLFFLYVLNTFDGWNNFCNVGTDTAKELKIKARAERLCAILADRVEKEKIILNDPVVEINQEDEEFSSVRTLEGRIFWAKRVVIAIPPKCIERISFRPKLPLGKEAILKRSFAGICLKYVVTFETVFWRNETISKNGIVIKLVDQKKELEKMKTYGEADIMGYSYVFDATTVHSMPALMGVAFSRKLRDSYEPSDREDVILNSLKEFFGEKVYSRLDYTDKLWGDEEYGPSYPCTVVSPGAFSVDYMMVQRPFLRVHWAGTETSTCYYGQMEGAVESADRVASEVTYYLNHVESEDPAVYTDAEEVKERTASVVSEDGDSVSQEGVLV
ncbi:Amine oxidase [flavin-containing] A [Holothuria leucospilota]|uniref:Amine oxidase n=1 Tax=Holothuria leucospilota TaxID=206669 RepID=A0A9Q1HB75_HOLLE|nr:Amine oxidase [flavin-containing] A [Holothuria leucospilota]